MTTADTGGGERGVVTNVQRASFHDGPGIRTTVFLKGCPLRCPWCHNPETVDPRPEVLVDPRRCLVCGECTAACRRDGGPLPAGAAVGGGGCVACLGCVEACPTGARELAGRALTVRDVMAEVVRDRMIYEESGGGVTFSGGEPLAQATFLLACLDACRRASCATAVDTCGLAPEDAVIAVASRCDLLLWDLKVLDAEAHERWTGAPLAPILANLRAASTTGTPIWLRLPVLPGINDDDRHWEAAVALARRIANLRRVSLLPYHRTGAAKLVRLGRPDLLAGTPAPDDARVETIAARFRAAGLPAHIGG